jgi:hypothetical protein
VVELLEELPEVPLEVPPLTVVPGVPPEVPPLTVVPGVPTEVPPLTVVTGMKQHCTLKTMSAFGCILTV